VNRKGFPPPQSLYFSWARPQDAYDTSQTPSALFLFRQTGAVDPRAQAYIERVNITPQKKDTYSGVFLCDSFKGITETFLY